jgi:hypothetical protein
MKINRNNYEAFFLDYYEGTLDANSIEALFLFLEKNPDLKAEFEEFEMMILPPENEKFPDKADLKQGRINSHTAEEYFIADHEGLLKEEEKDELHAFLDKQPSYRKEHALYGKVYLHPEVLAFPDKESLKRRIPVRRMPLYYALAAAASIALVIGLFVFPDKNIPDGIAFKSILRDTGINSKNFVSTNKIKDNGSKDPQSFTYVKKSSNSVRVPMINPDENILVGYNDHVLPGIDSQLIVITVPAPRQELVNVNPDNRDYLTVGEWVSDKVKDKIYEDQDERTPGKLKWLDVVAMVGKGVSRLTGQEIKVKSHYDDEGQLLAYQITAGKFAFAHNNQKP